MSDFLIEDKYYKLSEIYRCIQKNKSIVLSDESRKKVDSSRKSLLNAIGSGQTIYGVNTGFGKLSQIKINQDKLELLQTNLIISHSTGVGELTPNRIVKLMILLKIISLGRGYSGIRLKLINQMLQHYNAGSIPIVPSQGSVGASGDLAPLSHMSLPLIGLGKVKYKSSIITSKELLNKLNLKPIALSYKEGLALINGTQFSTAYGIETITRLKKLSKIADIAGAITVEGLMGTDKAFLKKVHDLKLHKGQKQSAKNLYNLLNDSEIKTSHKDCERVQDMYSLRCIPQVHGACRDSIESAENMIERELNSVSDNPLIFNDGEVVSAGNFHAESCAMAMDIAAIATAEFGSISERRIFALTKGDFGLPPFLIYEPGINSGIMMWQVTAASLVSENKGLCHPASIDNIPTGADQEDHVSMAPWSGRKLFKMLDNLEYILAIEIYCACLAIDFRKGLKAGKGVDIAFKLVRENVDTIIKDKLIGDDIQTIIKLIKNDQLLNKVENKIEIN